MIVISAEAIDLATIHQYLRSPHAGGETLFTGTARDHHAGKRVEQLEFEAYGEMALQQLHAIAETMRERWQVTKVALVHRVGRVAIGEICVVVGVSAPHRDAAFAACRYGIDTLKAEAAIWKKETYEGGEHWVANHP